MRDLRIRNDQLSEARAELARQALAEVRDAVGGDRRPTLDGELAGARMALSAAGIRLDRRRSEAELDPLSEALFAWAVREGGGSAARG